MVPAAATRCHFAQVPKTGGESVRIWLDKEQRGLFDTVGAACHALPRSRGVVRRCHASIPPTQSACRIATLREPVARFESAWRYAQQTKRLAGWRGLLARYNHSAARFVGEARRAGLGLQAMLLANNVTLFDPRVGDGLCCSSRAELTPPACAMRTPPCMWRQQGLETPILSPQAWWLDSFPGAAPVAELHVLCTASLERDLTNLLVQLAEPSDGNGPALGVHLPHNHQTASAQSNLAEADVAWLRVEYARDVALYERHCSSMATRNATRGTYLYTARGVFR